MSHGPDCEVCGGACDWPREEGGPDPYKEAREEARRWALGLPMFPVKQDDVIVWVVILLSLGFWLWSMYG